MKITEIRAVRLEMPRPAPVPGRRAGWPKDAEVANPMSRYPRYKRHRGSWTPSWGDVWCKVTLADGTWGLGHTSNGPAVAALIDAHLGPLLVGEDALASEKLADMLFRLTKPYGSTGLASYAVSAIDLALWDARGKLLEQPVYTLLGGPQKERMFCYATGNDVDWYLELGFQAFKLACPYGPADGLDGIKKNAEFVAQAREQIGPDRELMLDCWMAFDVEYSVRLAEALRPYRLKWMEECLIPEDLEAHRELRRRLPWQALATGEHWYTHVPFQWAAQHKVADILQPDIEWCGGLSTSRKIAAAAEAAGLSVMLHAGGNTVFGQHFSYAMPNVPWVECFVGSDPGVPLVDGWRQPGQAVPQDGWLVPSDSPGFGLEIKEEWLVPYNA
ncbi:MAG TPA: enolase C-terminal domain-like protein [Roseiflexaceae bacterium]|nr:enolase C-terminal domain-like protein [Roseiflexaceae bacterium]